MTLEIKTVEGVGTKSANSLLFTWHSLEVKPEVNDVEEVEGKDEEEEE